MIFWFFMKTLSRRSFEHSEVALFDLLATRINIKTIDKGKKITCAFGSEKQKKLQQIFTTILQHSNLIYIVGYKIITVLSFRTRFPQIKIV